MQKNSIYATADKLNPNFQQHMPQGRVQAHDLAFFMRKYAFMQKGGQPGTQKKKR